jgi:ATP-dependent 26S proteasome regulatory subunit
MAKVNEPRETAAVATMTNGVRTMSELEVLVRARYPLIYVISWEEQRVMRQVCKIAAQLGKKVFEWSVTTGLVGAEVAESQKKKDTGTQDPLTAMDNIIEFMEPALFVLKDFHPYMKEHNSAVIRRLRDVAASLRNTYKTVIIISPVLQLPAELEKEMSVVDFDLPTEQDFTTLLAKIVDEVKGNPKLDVTQVGKMRESLVHSLMGLTLAEAENVLAKALIQHHGFNTKSVEVVLSEKRQIIRKSGMLEYYEANEDLNSVGGMDELKGWILKRTVAFSEQAREFGLPSPKGVLLLGVQGCGKSLMAKAISNIWKLPLLRFDVGKVFGSLVGSSEENVRRSIQVAESVSPVVFWVDEIDKAFRGSRGSGASTDGGTSARVFGTFLTWLAEKKKPVFVVATANDVSMLPPELLRKGRFDEIFFVDLPNMEERKAIFKVHLTKRKFDVSLFDLDAMAKASDGFSGAEIEEAIISAMFDVFYEKKQLSTEQVLVSLNKTVPLSKTMSEDVDALRQWAKGRARPGTSSQLAAADSEQRKLEI